MIPSLNIIKNLWSILKQIFFSHRTYDTMTLSMINFLRMTIIILVEDQTKMLNFLLTKKLFYFVCFHRIFNFLNRFILFRKWASRHASLNPRIWPHLNLKRMGNQKKAVNWNWFHKQIDQIMHLKCSISNKI